MVVGGCTCHGKKSRSKVEHDVSGLTLDEVIHTLTSGMHDGKLLQSDPPLVPLCSHFTPDVILSVDNGAPKIHNMDLDPDLPLEHDVSGLTLDEEVIHTLTSGMHN